MDILDIDEALKDDSFIFLEDKTHDDVSNILQQWKSNNLIQQQQEQVYKLNSRTFTRPKRKLPQHLESNITNPQQSNLSPMVNMEIGGLVTTMQKSFLQDTSPPASICSSMDFSVDRMNASLVTSADFINVNFLQSGNGHDFLNDDTITNTGFHHSTNSYTLSDMIRDRKALESLTLSGDGTLIKDCNIGQIDDISITLSKTASSCSTMNNSTESVEANNRTVEMCKGMQCLAKNNTEGILHKTILLSDEMIGDTTLNLIENSMYSNRPSANAFDMVRNARTEYVETATKAANETFKKITPLDETICLNKINSTFDCQQLTPETNCDTPEADKHATAKKFYESTPQASGISHSNIPSTPSTEICNDINISPIVAPTSRLSVTRVLSETFDCDPNFKVSDQDKVSNSETFSESAPQELPEKFPNLNGTFHKSFSKLQDSEAAAAMRNVLSLAQAEADILAQNDDEEEFEQMLDEFSKIELNAEQLKMKKSLDSIKKRFSYGLSEKHERELSREAKDMHEVFKTCTEEQSTLQRSDSNNEKIPTVLEKGKNDLLPVGVTIKSSKLVTEMNASHGEYQRDFKKSIGNAKESPSELSASSSMSASGNCSERLLSRRSRLYDDINISTMQSQARSPELPFKQSSEENEPAGVLQKSDEILAGEEMAEGSDIVSAATNESSQNLEKKPRRLVAKRERDRDRFKTVAIVRDRLADADDNAEKLNVPCIDDMLDDQPEETADVYTEMVQPLQRFSRRDHSSIPSNKTQPNVTDKHEAKATKNVNYLTYKKPKDKNSETNPKQISTEPQPTSIIANNPSEPRSLSRPRYISGLQKFSVVSKATSAGDLGKTTEMSVAGKQSNLPVNSIAISTSKFGITALNLNRKPANVTGAPNGKKELKSPMGIKSKSFQNLSTNLAAVGLPTQKRNLYGFRPKASNSSVQQQRILTDNQKCDETVFKVPKLVSGIRAPSAVKRAGLARPSSGFYSLNVPASVKMAPPQQQDVETDRHSPIDNTSYDTSHSSVQSASSAWKPLSSIPTSVNTLYQLPNAPIQINTGVTGIPKPSGLRPPSNIKHSALPRKSTLLKR